MPRQMLEAKLHETIRMAREEIAVRDGLELEGGTNMLLETRGGHERRWKRYLAYKDSEVEWVGEVPEHWGLKRLKYISTVNDGTLSETTDSDFELLYVDISSVDPVLGIKNKELMTFENAPSRARRKVRHGDVILSTVRTYLRAISPINDPEPNMIVSTGFAVIRPKDGLESRFAAYALRAPYFVDEVVAKSVGVSYPAINANELITFNVALPSFPEQRTIAAFLDRETGRIDALIAKKERQIELLQEKRAALISHAVTKGLDPDAPMKGSGVEWLGEVPKRWEVMKLRRICRVQQGLQIAQANRYAEPGPNRFEYITVKSIHADDTLVSKEYIEKPTQSVLCASDDILLARTGATGEVFSDRIGVFHNNFFKVIYDRKLVDKNYLIYYLSDIKIKKHLIMLAGTTTIPDLNHGDFLDMPFSCPTFDEQKNIVIFLDRETACIANLTNKISESITKLREYRTALISAAVTGKIDVREELVS